MEMVGLILGTGWNKIAEILENKKETPFEKIFKRKTSVPGHQGKVIEGELFQKKIIILSGRFHTYEGYTSSQAAETIYFLKKEGVKKIVLTSAAGGA